MKTISFDASRWPLAVVRYGTQVDEGEFEELLNLIEGHLKRAIATRTRVALIYDSTSGYQASPRIRKRQAEWMKEHHELTRMHCAGVAFIITSGLVRGVLTAILWLSDMARPTQSWARSARLSASVPRDCVNMGMRFRPPTLLGRSSHQASSASAAEILVDAARPPANGTRIDGRWFSRSNP